MSMTSKMYTIKMAHAESSVFRWFLFSLSLSSIPFHDTKIYGCLAALNANKFEYEMLWALTCLSYYMCLVSECVCVCWCIVRALCIEWNGWQLCYHNAFSIMGFVIAAAYKWIYTMLRAHADHVYIWYLPENVKLLSLNLQRSRMKSASQGARSNYVSINEHWLFCAKETATIQSNISLWD